MTGTIECDVCHRRVTVPLGDAIKLVAIGVFLSGWAVLTIGLVLYLLERVS